MIPAHTVANILDAAKIEEVVADFVTLKKRGANYIACCPFHNEKTPSFTVSPTKNIYKCFGCGAAGNTSKFVMEHEHFSYPEALKYLAKKYHIHIEEESSEQVREEQHLRDSLFIVNKFAAEHFKKNLYETDEGKSVGLSYFKERGFRDETIKKFGLGYTLDKFDDLLKAAKAKGYKLEYLKKLGLATTKNNRDFDFFRNRVLFTIHNQSGKPIAFAGRTLKKDKKIPKYVNSPETDIYHKSNVLYALYFARTAIRKQNLCLIVEGYTDVISMHQAGIENVVASSGTSLTPGQIRLIKRYTPNITLLFDGDPAGVKAAMRGVDLILQEGMNVKIVMLPEGEDPDSFVQKEGRSGFETYLQTHTRDFIFFKTDLLLEEAANDPVKKGNLIREIIDTLAKIPDPIKRSLYVKECSAILDISESMIINETNRLKWKDVKNYAQKENAKAQKQAASPSSSEEPQFIPYDEYGNIIEPEPAPEPEPKKWAKVESEITERDLIKVLFDFGHKDYTLETQVAPFLISQTYEFNFNVPIYQSIINIYVSELQENRVPDLELFTDHEDKLIRETSIDIALTKYQVSHNWENMHEIYITPAIEKFKQELEGLINHFNLYQIKAMLDKNAQELKNAKSEEMVDALLEIRKQLYDSQVQLAGLLGTRIIH